MRAFLFIAIFIQTLLVFSINEIGATKQLMLDGVYNGENLLIINPIDGDGYTVESVVVNGICTKDEIRSSVFEIDFSSLGIKEGDRISINILYKGDTPPPQVFNPEAVKINHTFIFQNIEIDKQNENISWEIEDLKGIEKFEIEQYLWGKWVTVGTTNLADSMSQKQYKNKIVPHFGKNIWRIKILDATGQPYLSQPIKLQSRVAEVTLQKTSIDNEIVFSDFTTYQLVDDDGNFIVSGTAKKIDASSLDPGKYWISYDNKTESVKKK